METWKGQKATHTVAVKLDGVQAKLLNGIVVSRSGKPLYNIDPAHLEDGKRYEVFLGSFKETNSIVRTHDHGRKVGRDELYEIWPSTDPRIILPLDTDLETKFREIVAAGGEGLVIDQTYKMKSVETHDVEIIAVIPGRGKHTGRMGALVTPRGNVGTGFSDAERQLPWSIGDVIEVECMSLTEGGKFRMPRFVRHRWDKSLEI